MTEGKFGVMSDREILVELSTTCQGTSEDVHEINEHLQRLNGSVAKQGSRLVTLEVGQTFQTKKSIAQWGGLFGTFGALIAGGLFAFGQALGWW